MSKIKEQISKIANGLDLPENKKTKHSG